MNLIGSLISVGVMAAVGTGVVVFKTDVEDYVSAQTRGGQYVTMLKAGEAYAKKNQISLMRNDGSASMTPDIATLKNSGFLSANFAITTPARLGGDLSVVLKHEPVGCPGQSCVIQISVVPSTGTTMKDNQPDYNLAAKIALASGGYGWSGTPDMPTFLTKNGKQIQNPLGNIPAVAIASTWLPSNKPGSTDTHPEYQTTPCPAPQTGTITNTRNVWTDKWGGQGSTPWVYYSSSCVTPPPTCSNGATNYPTCTPPVCANGALDFPTCTPPTCANGASDFPTCTPPLTPKCANGATDFPTCTSSKCANGASDFPTCTPPSTPKCANGAIDYPTCTPSKCANGASDYPTCTPPKCANGASDWPTCTPPKCANGASDYPTCTPPKCANGASDWPTCTPPKCANGAPDYPICTFTPVPQPTSCSNGAGNYPICKIVIYCGAPSYNWKPYYIQAERGVIYKDDPNMIFETNHSLKGIWTWTLGEDGVDYGICSFDGGSAN